MRAIQKLNDSRFLGLPFLFGPFVISVVSIFFKIPFYDSAGGFQYKDAGAWASCIKALTFNGEFLPGAGEWCLRRPIFPEVASFIFRIYNSISFVALILSALFGAALYLLFIQARTILPLSGTLVTCTVTLCYWFIFCCTQILTESLAISVCVLGLVYLLKAKNSDSLKYLYLSIVLIGISQQIRPGNLFLPLVPICLIFGIEIKNRAFPIVNSLFLFSLPFLVTALIRRMLGNPDYANAGNAWASLYGLANNNSSWQTAYSIPGIPSGATDAQVSEVIKAATLESIRSDFVSVPISIFKNLAEIVTSYFPFISPISVLNSSLSIFANLIFFTWFIIRTSGKVRSNSISKTGISFIIVVICTSLFSYALAWKSEPARALMPTISFILIAFSIAVQGESRVPDTKALSTSKFTVPNFFSHFKEATTSVVLVLSLYLISMLSHVIAPVHPAMAPQKCPDGTFRLFMNSISVTNTSSIKSNPVYSWSNDLPKIIPGQLIQGLGFDGAGFISINAFSDVVLDRSELSRNCFEYTSNENHLGGFSDSGVRQIAKLVD